MQELPIGVQNFEKIRRNNYLYVDKTEKILSLAKTEKSYFLSRPRRFGKSLTLSTLEAMFQGKAELFKGLYAEEWVKEQAKHPSPVIKLDMSVLGFYKDSEGLNKAIINYLVRYYIKSYKLDISIQDSPSDVFLDIINEFYIKNGQVVLLIDEYDKPITDNINNLEKVNEMRETLPSFLVSYFKQHQINNFEQFRHLEVPLDFADEHEIEKANPESFLYQAGYLTIEKKERKNKSVFLTLDYPNEEVKQSISRLFLKDIYKIDRYIPLGDNLWKAIKSLNEGNIEKIVEIFNNALTKIPYSDFPKNQNEYWYRSLFVMLLRGGAGVTSFQESYTSEGRSDLIIPFDDKIIIIEFKFAKSSKGVPKARTEGEEQVKQYAKTYENEAKKIITVVLVADNRKRKVVI